MGAAEGHFKDILQVVNAKGRKLYPKIKLKLHNLDSECKYYTYLMHGDRDDKV